MTRSRTQHDAPPPAGQGPETVGALFIDRVNRSSTAEAFRIPTPDGSWESVSWTAVGERVTRLAAGLLALGIEPGERVAIMSGTRYEWIVADLAVMCAGAGAGTHHGEVGDDPLVAGTGHDGNALARLDPEREQARGQARHPLPDGGPGDRLPRAVRGRDAERLRSGRAVDTVDEQRTDGLRALPGGRRCVVLRPRSGHQRSRLARPGGG